MEFQTPDDQLLAMLLVARHLQNLVRRYEAGVVGLGLRIIERRVGMDAAGEVQAVLVARHGAETIEVHLRNCLEDWLCVDRDERPARVDPGLRAPAYAEDKLRATVDARVEILAITLLPADHPDRDARLAKLSEQFEQIRIVRVDPDREGESR